LITIAASHYCEKARWGLDLLELDDSQSPYYYTEDGHAPPFLAFETLPASGYKFSASPMLVYQDGSFLVKSDCILRKHCPFLYPKQISDRVEAMEDDLGLRVGCSVRSIVYYHMLRQPYYSTLSDILSKNTTVSKVEGVLLRAMMDKGVGTAMKKVVHVNRESYDASLPTLRQVFAELSETLNDGREYLCDDNDNANNDGSPLKCHGFTAADLTLAALAAPILQPECYFKTFGVPTETLPRELVDLQQELRKTKAGQHVLKMYQRHRPVATVSGAVVIKSGPDRDKIAWSRLLPVAALMGASLAATAAAVTALV
jgi:glutathione S-transferase